MIPAPGRGRHAAPPAALEDLRGTLCVGEFERAVPFAVKRYFLVYDVPSAKCAASTRTPLPPVPDLRGAVTVVADDGLQREEFLLDARRSASTCRP